MKLLTEGRRRVRRLGCIEIHGVLAALWWPAFALGTVFLAACLALLWWAARYGGAG